MAEMPKIVQVNIKPEFSPEDVQAALSPMLEVINDFWEKTKRTAELVIEALEQQQAPAKTEWEECSDGMMHEKGSGCHGRPDSEKAYDEDHEACEPDSECAGLNPSLHLKGEALEHYMSTREDHEACSEDPKHEHEVADVGFTPTPLISEVVDDGKVFRKRIDETPFAKSVPRIRPPAKGQVFLQDLETGETTDISERLSGGTVSIEWSGEKPGLVDMLAGKFEQSEIETEDGMLEGIPADLWRSLNSIYNAAYSYEEDDEKADEIRANYNDALQRIESVVDGTRLRIEMERNKVLDRMLRESQAQVASARRQIRELIPERDAQTMEIHNLKKELRNLNKGMERAAQARDAAEEEVAAHVSGTYSVMAQNRIDDLIGANELLRSQIESLKTEDTRLGKLAARQESRLEALQTTLEQERLVKGKILKERNELENLAQRLDDQLVVARQQRPRPGDLVMSRESYRDLMEERGKFRDRVEKDAKNREAQESRVVQVVAERDALQAQIDDRGPLYTQQEALDAIRLEADPAGNRVILTWGGGN